MADETKVTIKAKVAQKIINDGDVNSYEPLKGELVAIKDNNNDNIALAIGTENNGVTKLQELNYVEGKANSFYVTAGKSAGTSLGANATAEGNSVMASGINSHAEGNGTIASRPNSHAEGGGTTASGINSHAEGGYTTASSDSSHAEGGYTTASGGYSHAEGCRTTASGNYSHAEGHGTTASGCSQHVFGEYNKIDNVQTPGTKGKYVEIVGNGSGYQHRANARTLDWSGNEVLAGKLTVGSGATDDNDVPHLGQIKTMVVSSSNNGLVPAISGVTTQQAIFGAKKVDDVMVPQWLTLSGEGSISIPNVSKDADGIVPKYGPDAKDKILIIDENQNPVWKNVINSIPNVSEGTKGIVPAYGADAQNKILIIDENKKPTWVNAIDKSLFPPSIVNNGKYLMTQNGQYVWTEIIDDSSYNGLVDIINSPIEFLQKKQSS